MLEDKVLLIDDCREFYGGETIARTFAEGIALLQSQKWDLLYLDHDLGDPNPRNTGYGIMCFLEENPQHLPGRIVLVTSNPVGRQNMQVVIDRIYSKQ